MNEFDMASAIFIRCAARFICTTVEANSEKWVGRMREIAEDAFAAASVFRAVVDEPEEQQS